MHVIKRLFVWICTPVVVVALGVLGLSVATSSPAGAQSQPLDHFICYTTAPSTGAAFQPVPGTRLIDQFTPNGIVPVIGPNPTLQCDPAFKFINNVLKAAPVNPESHLVCLPLKKVAKQPVFTVSVGNQFGTGVYTVQKPKSFCLPSYKSIPPAPPPNMTPPYPPNLYHFTCYPVKPVAGTPQITAPGGVSVLDPEFGTAPTAVKVGKAKLLCAPTTKILPPPGGTFPADLQGLHLLCFSLSKTPTVPVVVDQNQFGQAPVTIVKTAYLCLPTTKSLLPPSRHHHG